MMPSQDWPETSLQGRINANAARALKNQVCLTAAAYSTDDTRKKSLFEQAVAAVDGIQGYTLDSNYGSMFQPGWCRDISRNHSGTILQQG